MSRGKTKTTKTINRPRFSTGERGWGFKENRLTPETIYEQVLFKPGYIGRYPLRIINRYRLLLRQQLRRRTPLKLVPCESWRGNNNAYANLKLPEPNIRVVILIKFSEFRKYARNGKFSKIRKQWRGERQPVGSVLALYELIEYKNSEFSNGERCVNVAPFKMPRVLRVFIPLLAAINNNRFLNLTWFGIQQTTFVFYLVYGGQTKSDINILILNEIPTRIKNNPEFYVLRIK